MLLLKVSVCEFANFETRNMYKNHLKCLYFRVYTCKAGRPAVKRPLETIDFAGFTIYMILHQNTLQTIDFASALCVLFGAPSLLCAFKVTTRDTCFIAYLLQIAHNFLCRLRPSPIFRGCFGSIYLHSVNKARGAIYLRAQ